MRPAARCTPVPVLMYHSVSDVPGPGTKALAVRRAAFERQLTVLDELGLTTVTVAELAAHWRRRAAGLPGPPLPARPVVLTFDDGYEDFHSAVLPALREHGATATLFVTTGWLADAGEERAGRPLGRMLCWKQLDEIAAEGVEVGGHSHSHPELDQLDPIALREELVRNLGLLEDRLQRPVSSFGYPFGYSDRRVRDAVRAAGYRAACAVSNAVASPDRQSPFALSRLTVSERTTPEAFRGLAQGRGVSRLLRRERALTKGYAVVRGVRRGLRRDLEYGP
ncbi:polysaccharide deacetylase family protein [Streptacidiphilus carbonis]|uniref:polysaccharide deacetylase family protein n=1 Tax=Streptacidiphilus carbonis TaxID=105422 RepID=UPI0005A9C108|nr:polysaccharide deacetylase family protein [Streptacidiphilus carbonis]